MTGAEKRIANLVPWKPGQSGNPRGHSEARRRAKRLREAMDSILEQEIPREWIENLDERVRAVLPADDLSWSELIALRVTIIAATARDPQDILRAASMILGAQAKPDEQLPPVKPQPPQLPATDERRREVAQQLGVDVDGVESR